MQVSSYEHDLKAAALLWNDIMLQLHIYMSF